MTNENFLRAGWKACFPEMLTATNFNGQVYTRMTSAAAGYGAIRAQGILGLTVENCFIADFYYGVASYFGDPLFRSVEFQGFRYSAATLGFGGFGSDVKAYDCMANGYYFGTLNIPDDPLTYTNTVYRGGIIGWDAIGSQCYASHLVLSGTTYGIFGRGFVNTHINDALFEGNTKEPLWITGGNPLYNQGAFTIDRMRVLTHRGDYPPSDRGTNVPLITLTGSQSKVDIGLITVASFEETPEALAWGWGYIYSVLAANDNELGIGRYTTNSFVRDIRPTASQVAYSQFYTPIVSTTSDFATPNYLFKRSGVDPFGFFMSSALILSTDSGSDGVWDPVVSFDATTTVSELRFGSILGSAATPHLGNIKGEFSVGTNISGGSITYDSGLGTGNATGSNHSWRVPEKVASGTGSQVLRTVLGVGMPVTPVQGNTSIELYAFDGTSWTFVGRPSVSNPDQMGPGLSGLTFINPSYSLRSATNVSSFPYTFSAQDRIVLCHGSGARAVAIPPAAGRSSMRVLVIDAAGNASSGTITVTTGGGTINGLGSYPITTDYGSFEATPNGTNWFIIQ